MKLAHCVSFINLDSACWDSEGKLLYIAKADIKGIGGGIHCGKVEEGELGKFMFYHNR